MERNTHHRRVVAIATALLFLTGTALAGTKVTKEKRGKTRKGNVAGAAREAGTRATGGPDAFGYRYVDQAEPIMTFSFLDISATGTSIVAGDEASSGSVALGAPFTFYGTTYVALNMATNGYVSTDVTDAGGDDSNDCPLPAVPSDGGGARMYPLHDDLVTANGLTQFFATCPRANELGTGTPEACTVFQWDDTNHLGSTATFRMQTVLYHTSGVVLHQVQGDPDTGAGSTVGIQNDGATIGLMYACNTAGSMAGNRAIGFYLCGTITLAPATLPGGTVGTAYNQTITATGGTSPYTFGVTAGSLPPGLALSGAGGLTGTPTAAGTFAFTVTATDAKGCTGSQAYSVDIVPLCGTITLSPATLPGGREGVAYNQTLTAAGGTAPYTFAVTAGALPAGLTLAAGGALTGTPTAQGVFGFTVTATDANGCTGIGIYTLVIDPAVDILVGAGLGQPNTNRVRVFTAGGVLTVVDFLAYGAGQFGTNVASGNVDATIEGEILTGPGPGAVYGPQVRGFRADATVLNKINFYAYGTLRYGVNAGAGEIDGDGFDEILSGAGPGAVFGPHVRGWNFDGATLSAISKVNFFAYNTLRWGVNVDDGDVENDGFAELITGPGPGVVFGPQVRGFNYDAATTTSIAKINFNAFASLSYGVNVSSADVDADGFSELVGGQGPGSTLASSFAGFNFDGAGVTAAPGYTITLFAGTNYGGRVGHGDLNGDGRADLLAGKGRDPLADSGMDVYSYVANTLNQLTPPGAFLTFPAGFTYGVNPAGAELGY